MTATVRAKLPAHFYDDHRNRDLPSGIEVKRLGVYTDGDKWTRHRYVVVDLDREAYDDLLSDADYYNDAEMMENERGLWNSARATLRALAKIERPA